MGVKLRNSEKYLSETGQNYFSPIYTVRSYQGKNRLVVACVSSADINDNTVNSVDLDGRVPDGSDSIFIGAVSNLTLWMGWWFDDTLGLSIADTPITVEMTGSIFGRIHIQVMEFIGVKQNSIVNVNSNTGMYTNRISTSVNVSSDNSIAVGAIASDNKYIRNPINLTKAVKQKITPNSCACGYDLDVYGSNVSLGWKGYFNIGAFIGATFESF